MGRSWMMAAVLAGTVLAGSATAAPSRCSMTNLRACPNTNMLVWQPGFDVAMRRFLGASGRGRVDYLYPGPLARQIADVLGGPPDERRDVPGGGFLFTACRAHSCPEKGAIAFNAVNRITAIAVVSFHCGRSGGTCSKDPFLDVYDRGDAAALAARPLIVGWAMAASADDGRVFGNRPTGSPVLHRPAGQLSN